MDKLRFFLTLRIVISLLVPALFAIGKKSKDVLSMHLAIGQHHHTLTQIWLWKHNLSTLLPPKC